jgi:hypothetical protein
MEGGGRREEGGGRREEEEKAEERLCVRYFVVIGRISIVQLHIIVF